MTDQNPKFDRDFSILILAGGRGERMGGRDKGLVPLAGRPAIEHLLARLQPHSKHIFISANRNLERYAGYGHPVIEDTLEAFPGPLAGMLTGLMVCRTPWMLVLPVDAPLVSPQYPARMLQCAQRGPELACVAEFEGRMEPVFCVLHRDLRASLQDYLQGGQRSVRDWITAIGARRVDFSDTPEQFLNMNRETDAHELEARLKAEDDHEPAV